jgi:uncharacterized membrane protein YdjX (TVP38/TMEM64 family)
MLVFSFFSLWLSVYLNATAEGVLSYLLILSIGIMHGANDLKLVNTTSKDFITKLGIYIALVIIAALFFLQFLPLATALFIFLSAYHFGEQHWGFVYLYQNAFIGHIIRFMVCSFSLCFLD